VKIYPIGNYKQLNLWLLFLIGFSPALIVGVSFGLEILPTILYPVGKFTLLLISIYYLWPIRWRKPSAEEIKRGLAHGIILGAIPFFFLQAGGLEMIPSAPLKEKMIRLGFLEFFYPLVLMISLGNAGFEEWFFRGFLVGQIRRRFTLLRTTLLGALLFMPHHFVILWNYMPLDWNLLFTAATAVAGAYWSYFRAKGETLYTLWFSHIFCDLLIVGLGGKILLGL